MSKGPDRKSERDRPDRRLRVSDSRPPLRKQHPGFPHSRKREIHSHKSLVQELLYLTEGESWHTTVVPQCEAIDRLRRASNPRGFESRFDTEQIMQLDFVGLLVQERRLRKTLTLLTAQQPALAALRDAIGFATPHEHRADRRPGMNHGVPNPSTPYRIIQHFLPADVRNKIYRALHHDLTLRLFEYPEVVADSHLTFLDSIRQNTHYTAPHLDPKTGEVRNADSITAPQAGFLSTKSGLNRVGDGFKAPIIITRSGIVLHVSAHPNNFSEPGVGQIAVADLGQTFRPLTPARGGILVADGGFASNTVRRGVRSIGYTEIIHPVSHGPDNHARVQKENERRLAIQGYPNWSANGHRELMCNCGGGRTERRFDETQSGIVIPRTVGRCSNCGTITITSGQWRITPAGFVRTNPTDPKDADDVDLLFGNPYTYNDPHSEEYGKQRFSQDEGFHGLLATRYGLFDRPGYYRHPIEFENDLLAAICLLHAAALVYYQHLHHS